MVAPVIDSLPEVALRGDAANDFAIKADAFVGSLPNMVTQINVSISFANDVEVNIIALEASAAQSVIDSANAALSAQGYRDTTLTYRNEAEGFKNDSDTNLANSLSALGLPALTGNQSKSLTVTTDGLSVEWSSLGGAVGDVIYSADPTAYPVPAYLECNGNSFNKITYSQLFDILGEDLNFVANYNSVLANPGIAVRRNGVTFVAVGYSSSPYIQGFIRSGDSLNGPYSGSGIQSANVEHITWADNSYFVAVHGGTSWEIRLYWVNGLTITGQSTSFLPSIISSTTVYGAQYSNDGNHLVVGNSNANNNSESVSIYKKTGSTTHTLISASWGGHVTGSVKKIAWTPDDNYVAFGGYQSSSINGIKVLKRVGDTFTDIPITQPGTALTNGIETVTWDDTGTYLFLTTFSANVTRLHVYKRVGDSITKLPNSEDIGSQANDMAYGNNTVIVTVQSSPHIETFTWDSDTETLTSKPLISTFANDGYSIDIYNEEVLVGTADGGIRARLYEFNAAVPDIDTGDPLVKAYISTGET